MLAQVGGVLFAPAAKLIAIRLVQQLLLEALYRKVIVPLTVGQQMPGKSAHSNSRALMLLLNIPFLCESMAWAYYARRCAGFFPVYQRRASVCQCLLKEGEKSLA